MNYQITNGPYLLNYLYFIDKNNRYYLKIGKVDNKKASAIISQIRLLDTKRLVNKIGVLNKERFEEIKKAVKNLI